MAAGILSAKEGEEEEEERGQVLVLRDDLTLASYDGKGVLQFETSLQPNSSHSYSFAQCPVTAQLLREETVVSLEQGWEAVVFVLLTSDNPSPSPNEANPNEANPSNNNSNNNPGAGVSLQSHCLSAVNVFAVRGSDGALLWRYSDSNPNPSSNPAPRSPPTSSESREDSVPLAFAATPFSASVFRQLRHYEHTATTTSYTTTGNTTGQRGRMRHWRDLAAHSLAQLLPHHWLSAADNALALRHLAFAHPHNRHVPRPDPKSPKTVSKPSNTQKKTQFPNALEHLPTGHTGNQHGARLAGNALVVHHRTGITVLATGTGQQVTGMLPLDTGIAYQDVNGDGIVDALYFAPARAPEDTLTGNTDGTATGNTGNTMCELVVLSGIPAQARLFRAENFCSPAVGTGPRGPHSRHRLPVDQAVISGNLPPQHTGTTSDTPVLTRAWLRPRHTGSHHHGNGKGVTGKTSLVVQSSTGTVTAFSGTGKTLWQVTNYHKYGFLPVDDAGNTGKQVRGLQAYGTGILGNGKGVAGIEEMVLVVSDAVLTLLAVDTGKVVASVEVGTGTAHRLWQGPELADFDGDGVTDLLVLTETGHSREGSAGGSVEEVVLLGYRVEVTPAYSPLFWPFFFLLLLSTLLFLSKLSFGKGNGTNSTNGNGSSGAKLQSLLAVQWTSVRATDNMHLD